MRLASDVMEHARYTISDAHPPTGDQPQAIAAIGEGIDAGERFQTLLGVTGSGKTFTMANIIAESGRPALVIAHNKTLAAQLCNEFREYLPGAAVEYFVSYYDYYQPEAYIASSDTYIEKDASINDEIDRLRHAATAALLTRRDVVIVASVSCIYGMGSPERYAERLVMLIYGMGSPERYAERLVMLQAGAQVSRDDIFRRLVEVQYQRNDMVLERGRFRARGDVFEIQPVNAETAYRVSMFGDEIESITHFHPVTGEVFGDLQYAAIYPATHYVTPQDTLEKAVSEIRAELEERCALFDAQGKLVESHRLRQRTEYDMEMLREVGFCSGIENYSRILDGRAPGEPPATLLDFFPSDFLCFIDESHNTVPQLRGMYEGDRSRKLALIDHGFRLPSAADNRPIRLEEFLERVGQVVFVSATPGDFERTQSSRIVEQIIRPTGLVDPEVDVRPTTNQVDDLMGEVRRRVEADERVLVTTLTKRMAEDLTDYLVDAGIKARYLHSDIDAIERIKVVRELRLGEFDVLVGVNLLREGLDLPEVTLVAILDADKEGFLRGQTALIQTIGRAARNVNGRVLMYADRETEAMRVAMEETARRREIQRRHNEEHGITPASITKGVSDIVEFLGLTGGSGRKRTRPEHAVPEGATPDEIRRVMVEVEQEMLAAAEDLRFERAAELRDRLAALREELGDEPVGAEAGAA